MKTPRSFSASCSATRVDVISLKNLCVIGKSGNLAWSNNIWQRVHTQKGCGLIMADCRLQTLQMIMRDAKKVCWVLTKTAKKEQLGGYHETFFPSWWIFSSIKNLKWTSVLFFLDIDECSASPSVCDINAKCSNTRGSYYCTCNSGFTGDGKNCQGRRK